MQIGKHINNAQMHRNIEYPDSTVFITEYCRFSIAEMDNEKSIFFDRYGEVTLNDLKNKWVLDNEMLNQILNLHLESEGGRQQINGSSILNKNNQELAMKYSLDE